MKETIKDAGYSYLGFCRETGKHWLVNNDTGKLEAFVARKNHASWGLVYKNTHLEFVCSLAK